ncbi:MAG: hypothetical protein DRQ47_05725 [Gammaproteobacteria bacterium]|nr:MAG: hypothetical protein DRQ47_05725 [Gammaproteobacteria bacterium]
MAEIIFPLNPDIGDKFSSGVFYWECVGQVPSIWNRLPIPTKISSEFPPGSPVEGQEWFDTSSGSSYTWYSNGYGQWVKED